MHLGVWGSRYNKWKTKEKKKTKQNKYIYMLFSYNHTQLSESVFAIDKTAVSFWWHGSTYLAIALENVLVLTPVNLIAGVLHASPRNYLRRSQNKGHL